MNAKVQSLLSQSAEGFYALGREMLESGEDVAAGACFVAHRKLLALQEFGQGRQMPFAAEGQPFDKPKAERKPRKKKSEGTIDAPYEAETKAEAKAAPAVESSAANGNARTAAP